MYRLIKRLFDVCFALVVTLLLSPVLVIVIIVLSLTGEHEVFYLQERVGHKNSRFNIIKFATMLKNSPNMLTGSLTTRDDPRVTRIGRYLRKNKINELPQLLNVLKGDMSVVGARPQMDVDFFVYPEHVQKEIYKFRPGITSLASIIFRDEEALMSQTKRDIKEYYANVIAPYKGEVELWYNRNRNFINDTKIIFITLWVVVFPESRLVYKWFPKIPKNNMKHE